MLLEKQSPEERTAMVWLVPASLAGAMACCHAGAFPCSWLSAVQSFPAVAAWLQPWALSVQSPWLTLVGAVWALAWLVLGAVCLLEKVAGCTLNCSNEPWAFLWK